MVVHGLLLNGPLISNGPLLKVMRIFKIFVHLIKLKIMLSAWTSLTYI